jgi:hypothetical protein
MNRAALANVLLRAHIALARRSPIGIALTVLLVAMVGSSGWLVWQRTMLERETALAARMSALPKKEHKAEAPPADDNLGLFYRSLGERRYAEQQLKTMFALASKTGLVLNKGDYREAWDRNAKLYTYQVTLPVKGSYRAIWDFALQALAAIPFASLDDISFRRDAIGDANVEARLRFTLYLAARPAGEGA